MIYLEVVFVQVVRAAVELLEGCPQDERKAPKHPQHVNANDQELDPNNDTCGDFELPFANPIAPVGDECVEDRCAVPGQEEYAQKQR